MLKLAWLMALSDQTAVAAEASICRAITRAVILLLDSDDQQPILEELATFVNAHYKVQYVGGLHIDRLVSYVTRTGMLNREALLELPPATALKLFRGLVAGKVAPTGSGEKMPAQNAITLVEAFGMYLESERIGELGPGMWLTALDIVRRGSGFPSNVAAAVKAKYREGLQRAEGAASKQGRGRLLRGRRTPPNVD